MDRDFNTDFYGKIAKDLGIESVIEGELPLGVTAQERSNGQSTFKFIMNFSHEKKEVDLKSAVYTDMLNGGEVKGKLILPKYGVRILKE